MDTVYIPIELIDEEEVLVETDEVDGDLDELISDILNGYAPHRVIVVDTYETDVSKEVAREVIGRAWDLDLEISQDVRDFAIRHGVTVPIDIRVSNINGNK